MSEGYIWEDFQVEETGSAKSPEEARGLRETARLYWQDRQDKWPENEDRGRPGSLGVRGATAGL